MQRARFRLLSAALLASCSILMTVPASAQESALDALRAATKASPGDAEAALALGRALRRAGRDAEAAQELRRASGLGAGKSPEMNVRIRWESARAAVARRDFGQAMVNCRLVAAQPGGAAAGQACTAEAHLLYRRASEALVSTAQALAGGKQIYEAKVAEGLAKELELKEAEAEASLREAIGWKPDAWEAHLHLGRVLVHSGKRDEGVAELRKAIALDPAGPEAAYELARVLAPAPEALTLLQRAVKERPTYVAALLKLADLELAAGHLAEARQAAEAAIKGDPRDHGAHTTIGRVALGEGKPDDAIKEGQAALALLGNSAPAKLLIADAYAKKGEIDLAVESYQAAYGLDHGDPTALVHASEACLALGRPTSAKAFGEKATKEFPSWGPGFAALGDALAADKDVPGAKAAYERALKADGPVDKARVKSKLDALTARR